MEENPNERKCLDCGKTFYIDDYNTWIKDCENCWEKHKERNKIKS